MLRIIRLVTGIMAAALRGVRRLANGNPKFDDGPELEFDIAWHTVVPTTSSWPCTQPPFWPNPGDEVEAWSVHASAWFPAVVVASSDNPWEPIVVRLKGNASSVHDKLRRDLVRPLRRLAGARRGCGPDVDYDAYDRDNIRHIEECTGCRECAGVGRYYTHCRKCGRMKHREFLDGSPSSSTQSGENGLCWFCLPTWPYTRDYYTRLARERTCASRV